MGVRRTGADFLRTSLRGGSSSILPIRMADCASSQSFQLRYWLIAVLTTSSVERPRDAAVCLNTASRDGDKTTVTLGIQMLPCCGGYCPLAVTSDRFTLADQPTIMPRVVSHPSAKTKITWGTTKRMKTHMSQKCQTRATSNPPKIAANEWNCMGL